jgi:hypothetical protein
VDKKVNKARGSAAAFSALALVASLALSLAFSTAGVRASTAHQAGNTNSITVPAGGTATLSVRGFCMDFGKPFPTQNTSVKGLAPDNIRAALNYSIQKGYTEGNPAQVEQAIWFLRDNTWHNAADHAVGQEIANNATSANAPQTGTGTALADAVAQNKVTVTAPFKAQTADHFYGDAQVQIKNTGTADIQIYMPIGTVFTVPNSNGAFQDLAAYTLNSQPAQAATTTASPAVTASAVVTGTASPAVTAEPTLTSVVTGTTTVETPTAAATTVAETPTTGATATTAVAETPTSEATATTTSGVLPQTGSGDDNMIVWTLVVMALGLLAIGTGALAVQKRKL